MAKKKEPDMIELAKQLLGEEVFTNMIRDHIEMRVERILEDSLTDQMYDAIDAEIDEQMRNGDLRKLVAIAIEDQTEELTKFIQEQVKEKLSDFVTYDLLGRT